MSTGEVIGCVIGFVLGVLISLVAYYWNKENKE